MDEAVAAARWLHELDLRRALRVVPVAGGAVVLHDDFPSAHDHNKLSVIAAAEGRVLAADAERILAGAGRSHRLIEFRTGDDAGAAGLLAAGYARSDDLVMTLAATPDRTRPAVQVRVLTLQQRMTASTDGWRRDLPEAEPDVWRQLGERITTVLDASQATFLGVLDEEGRVVARTDLYLRDGIAQVEEVVTDQTHRGRGLATALVLAAIDRAQQAAVRSVFLVADVEDWPRRFYARLGFQDGLVLATFTAAPGATPVEGRVAACS